MATTVHGRQQLDDAVVEHSSWVLLLLTTLLMGTRHDEMKGSGNGKFVEGHGRLRKFDLRDCCNLSPWAMFCPCAFGEWVLWLLIHGVFGWNCIVWPCATSYGNPHPCKRTEKTKIHPGDGDMVCIGGDKLNCIFAVGHYSGRSMTGGLI